MTTTDIAPTPEIENFDSFGLSAPVLEAMKEMGYSTPTPIQKQALPILLGDAQDFIGLASTGTGKTMAFGIPLVEKIDSTTKATQALVLSPTRELALQVAEQLVKVGKKKNIRVVTIYGGASYRTQMEGIKKGAHIVVATPGRLVDFLEQKIIKLNQVETVVLDEADEMISMGFKDDLEFILKATHPDDAGASDRAACKTWLFSATMSPEIRRVAAQYLENPQTVQVSKQGSTADTIEQIYYTVKNSSKTEVIGRLLQTAPEFYGIIFCQTKMEVAELADILTARGFPADSLHGDKSQQEREATLRKFRDRKVKVIVATDVAARGLDIKDLTHVINHSLPWDAESYVHRIGRTGRSGKKGVAITLVNPEQLHQLRRVMQSTKAQFTKGIVPSADQVAGLKIKEVIDRLTTMKADSYELSLANDLVVDLVSAEEADLSAFTKEDILARFIAAYFPNVFVKKDVPLDYMGDKVPRELLPRDPRDNRFTSNRDDRGGDRGGRGGDRGGFRRSGPRRDYGDRNDRGDRGDRQPRSFDRAERSERPVERSFDRPERSSSNDRPERSSSDRGGFRGNRSSSRDNSSGPRTESGFREGGYSERAPRESGTQRARSFGDGEQRSERPSVSSGIKRFRGNKSTSPSSDGGAPRRRFRD
ncbi:DEAD-box ATP-dependent RNA helicase CshA [compost metagenome]